VVLAFPSHGFGGYFVALCFTDMLYLHTWPIAKSLRQCELATATPRN
jgi:hypothetical protein